MDCKIKNSHYINSRFSTDKEKKLNEFKKENITQDMDDKKNLVIENLKFFIQILK